MAAEYLNKLFKAKKEFIFIVFITGILLLIVGRADTKPPEKTPVISETASEDIEKRLEDALSAVEGVGGVKVVIYYKSSAQKTIARDKTEETDKDQKRFEEKVVLTNGGDPVVLRENSREIEGVLIVAQGGGSQKTRAELISAAQALLGIEAHKIEVLKMK